MFSRDHQRGAVLGAVEAPLFCIPSFASALASQAAADVLSALLRSGGVDKSRACSFSPARLARRSLRSCSRAVPRGNTQARTLLNKSAPNEDKLCSAVGARFFFLSPLPPFYGAKPQEVRHQTTLREYTICKRYAALAPGHVPSRASRFRWERWRKIQYALLCRYTGCGFSRRFIYLRFASRDEKQPNTFSRQRVRTFLPPASLCPSPGVFLAFTFALRIVTSALNVCISVSAV